MAITHRLALGRDLLTWAREMAQAGVPAIQLREKDLDDAQILELARDLRLLLPASTALLVNGRADLALAAGAQGVHLPSDEVSTERLRRAYPRPFLIGRSTHHVNEIRRELAMGADYATFGPVYPTPSKERFGPPAGLRALKEAVLPGLPILALGGVQLESLHALRGAGAHGAAGIRVFFDEARTRQLVLRSRGASSGSRTGEPLG
jgi:thiamine-phosphate pyrophosphorylase